MNKDVVLIRLEASNADVMLMPDDLHCMMSLM